MKQTQKLPLRKAEDARGRSVKILDPVRMYLLRPIASRVLNRPETIPTPTLRRIAEALDPYWTRRGWLIIMVYVVGLVLCYSGNLYYRFYISSGPSWDLIGMMFPVAQFVFLFGAFYATWVIAKRARRLRIVPVMLSHHRCPHCGYDIRDLAGDDEDGATVCPECGCAWMLADASNAADG